MYSINKQLLKHRIESNYANFRSEVDLLGGGCVYKMAHRIVAVEEAYYQLTNHDWIGTDEEALFFLQFHNPLELIADVMRDLEREQLLNIDEAINIILDDEVENYIASEFDYDDCGGGDSYLDSLFANDGYFCYIPAARGFVSE